jgi:hypothetical protein
VATADELRIREAISDDGARFLELKHVLDRETTFMLREPGERTETPADMTLRLRAIGDASNSIVLVAEEDQALAGYVEALEASFAATGIAPTSSWACARRSRAVESAPRSCAS